MATPVPPGAPRPGNHPPNPNFNPNVLPNPQSLSDNMQNLNLHRPPSMPMSAPRPSSTPFPAPFSRPGPPPVRPSMPGPSQPSFPPPGRPSGPPVSQSQPSPLGYRPPPPATTFPPTRQMAPPPPGARPGGSVSPPLSTGPVVPPSGAPNFASGALPGGPRFPPPAGVAPQPPFGPSTAPPQPQTMHALLGSAPPSAPVQQQQRSPFAVVSQPPPVPPYGSQPWPMQPDQVSLEDSYFYSLNFTLPKISSYMVWKLIEVSTGCLICTTLKCGQYVVAHSVSSSLVLKCCLQEGKAYESSTVCISSIFTQKID